MKASSEEEVEDVKILVTEKCLICGKVAVTWCGHVRKGNKRVLAGWCRKHRASISEFRGPRGYIGPWLERMGTVEREV